MLGRHPCQCPSRLAAGTVDSLIGKLRSIFRSLGRSNGWDDFSCQGNPVIHHSIKSYLKSIQLEQAQARTPSKQATPLFLDKFLRIVRYLRTLLIDPNLSSLDRYLYTRDLAFFTLSFSSGGRASDLGRLYTIDILQSPNHESLIIHQRIGKTLRGKNTRVTPVLRMSNQAICPVANLRYYVSVCRALGISLIPGFLFRSTSPSGGIKDQPFLHHAVQARLHTYLVQLGIYEGETPHSFRSGTAIILRLLGASKDQVARHIGWQSTRMVDHYTQVEKVMGWSNDSNSLENSRDISLDNQELMGKLGAEFQEKNLLIGFTLAFGDS